MVEKQWFRSVVAHHVSFTFIKDMPCLESRAEKVASSILAETFVLAFASPSFVRFGKVPTWQDFLVFGGWMDGITKGRLTGKERKNWLDSMRG